MKPKIRGQRVSRARSGGTQRAALRQRSTMGVLPLLALMAWLCPASRATHQGHPDIVLAPVSSLAVLPCALQTHPPSASAFRSFGLSWDLEVTSPGRGLVSVLSVGSDGVVRRGRDGPGLRAVLGGVSSRDFSLRLWDVQPQDSGTFRCSARRGAERVKRKVRLYVVQATICSRRPILEGDRVDLTCNITDGAPRPAFSWERDGVEVNDSHRIIFWDGGRGISLREVGAQDTGDWVCRVRSGGVETKAVYTLKVYGFSRPKSETRTVFADAGSNASLSLPLFPGTSRFTAEWDWNRAGEEPGADDLMDEGRSARFRSHLGEKSGLQLTVTELRDTDRGVYTGCLRLRDRWAERSVRLEVAWVSPSREGPISLGETLRLEVRSTFPDRIESYRWLGPNASQAIDQETRGNLTIASVGLSDAGQWVCELLRDGELEGSISYILEVRVLERQEGDKVKPTAWGTLFTIMGSLVILVVILLVVLCTWIKSRRRNFPALEITLPTLSSSKKQ